MSLPWDLSLEDMEKPIIQEEKIAPTLLAHYCSLNLDAEPLEEPHTGIMCNLGALELEPYAIRRLLAAGLTVARLDLRKLESHARMQLTQSLRRAVLDYSAETGFIYPLAVIMEVRGPDISIGGLSNSPVRLEETQGIQLTTDVTWRECGNKDHLYVGWDRLTDLQEGDTVFLESVSTQNIALLVNSVGDDSVYCTVTLGGSVNPNAAVRISQVPRDNIPPPVTVVQSVPSIPDSNSSSRSMEHVDQQAAWAVSNDVDAILIPALKAADVQRMRDVLGEEGKHILVIVCIETAVAVDNAEEILAAADGLYIDRSILAVELPVEKVFIVQKMLMARCVQRGKPCICRSVINEQIPTLCVGDLAGLVLDGVDIIALEMQYELIAGWNNTGAGENAIRAAEQCIAAASVVCRQAERVMYKPHMYGNMDLMMSPLDEPTRAVCVSAVELALRARATVIICLTTSGRSARLLAHARPPCPIIAVTRSCCVSRQLRLWRGVRPIHYTQAPVTSWECDVQARVKVALRYLAYRGSINAGDAYVVTKSSGRGSGFTDSMRLSYVTPLDTFIEHVEN